MQWAFQTPRRLYRTDRTFETSRSQGRARMEGRARLRVATDLVCTAPCRNPSSCKQLSPRPTTVARVECGRMLASSSCSRLSTRSQTGLRIRREGSTIPLTPPFSEYLLQLLHNSTSMLMMPASACCGSHQLADAAAVLALTSALHSPVPFPGISSFSEPATCRMRSKGVSRPLTIWRLRSSITPLMSKPAALSNARSKKRSLVWATLSPRSSRYNCVELCLCWPLAFKFPVHLVCHDLLESRCLGCVHALMFLHVTYRSALCSASCRWLSSSCLARFSACSSSNGKRALDSTRNPQCPQ